MKKKRVPAIANSIVIYKSKIEMMKRIISAINEIAQFFIIFHRNVHF